MFILPEQSFGATNETIRLVDSSRLRLDVKGTAGEWRFKVGRYCSGNSRLLFGISAALTPILLHRIDDIGRGVSPGFHFQGLSSKGKTTILDTAGSVIGGSKTNPYYSNWRGTVTGLEMLAKRHNNLPLMLDEIGQADPRVLGNMIYQLATGEGASRGTKQLGLAPTPTWRTLLLSTGELRPEDKMKEARGPGSKFRGGQELRLLNIPAVVDEKLGVFENLHGFETPQAFANALKQGSSQYYGSILREFLQLLTQHLDENVQWFREKFLKLSDELSKEGSGEVPRAASHFAAVAAAGELAIKLRVFEFDPGECAAAVKKCFDAWRVGRGSTGSSDEHLQLLQVQNFIQEEASGHLEDMDYPLQDKDGNPRPRQRCTPHYGFRGYTKGVKEYWVHLESFRNKVCAGYDPEAVFKLLAKKGMLVFDTNERTRQRSCHDGRLRFVVILHNKLFGIEPDPESITIQNSSGLLEDFSQKAPPF